MTRTVYSNRNPQDQTIPVVRFDLVESGVRWKTQSPYGNTFTAKGLHIFVVQNGALFVSRRTNSSGMRVVGHHDLAYGEPVEFAGEIMFGGRSNQRGILGYWNDVTGHYHLPGSPMNPEVVPLLPQALFRPYGGTSQ